MTSSNDDHFGAIPEEQMLRINQLCNEFEAAWRTGACPAVEGVLQTVAMDWRLIALRELLPIELEYRQRRGQPISLTEGAARFPDLDHTWLAELFTPGAVKDAAAASIPCVPEKLGDYQLRERLGEGGMGTVFKAVHARMDRIVALKILRPELQRDPVWRQRFDREAKAVARLQHPNIVAALDAREECGVLFLVTEYIDGADLAEIVRRDGPLTVDQAVDAVMQAARGLDFAHRQGVIHRDIKPANLLRDRHGTVKLLDMGLARLHTPDQADGIVLTRPGVMLGTAAFISPEQARDTRSADARSDIYSLGCTLYFLLTGRPIFDAPTALDTALAHLHQPVPSLTDMVGAPATLDEIYRRMVAKDPGDRFQTAAEVVAALETLGLEDTSVATEDDSAISADLFTPTAPIVGVADRRDTVASLRSSRRQWLMTAGVGALAATGWGFYTWGKGGDVSPDHQPVGTSEPDAHKSFELEFNGSSSYVAVPSLEPTAGATYTLEAIVRPYSFRAANVISWLGPDWMALYLNANGCWGLARRFGETPHLIVATEPTPAQTTVHVAGVFDGSTLSLFVDGRRVPIEPAQFFLAETRGGLHIGGAPSELLPEDRFFHGAIDAVLVSSGIRYPSDFPKPSQLSADADAIALFPFDEGSGASTSSVGPHRFSGTIVDAKWRPTGV